MTDVPQVAARPTVPAPGSAPGSAPGPAPSRAATLRDGVCMAVGTLTAVPVPPPRRIDRRVAGTAMALAPVAALVPGLAAAGVLLGARVLGASSLLGAAGAIGAVALTTRGLHLDGLADTADGLAASYDRERAHAVMKRGDVGPMGAATLVLVLLVQVAALAQADERSGPVAALAAVLVGRATLTLACTRGVPAARPDGLGAAVAGSVPRRVTALVWVAVCGACWALTGHPEAVAAPVMAVAVVTSVLVRATRRLGGITGDVLGAGVEAATAAALTALAVLP